MNLIFIYGPPAAGKLTVASELSTRIGYKLLDNHKALDYLPEIFPRTDPRFDDIRSSLGRKIRLDIFNSAALAGVNLITTFAPLSDGATDFMREVLKVVKTAGGRVLFVQLLPTNEVLLQRVSGESRKNKKIETIERWQEVVGDNPRAFETFTEIEHLVVDNSKLSPTETVNKIIDYYKI